MFSRHLLVGSFLFFFVGHGTCSSQDDSYLEQLFLKSTRLDGQDYTFVRDYLANLIQKDDGKESIKKLVTKFSSDKDFRARDLANALAVRLKFPEQVNQWELSLSGYVRLVKPLENKKVEIQFLPTSKPVVEKKVDPVIVVDETGLPFYIDKMYDQPKYTNEKQIGHLLTILKHFDRMEAGYAVADHFLRNAGRDSRVCELMLQFGEVTAPRMRNSIKLAPVDRENHLLKRLTTPEYLMIANARKSAELLAKMGDRQAIPILMEKLKHDISGDQAGAYAEALAELKAKESIPLIFEHLVRNAFASPHVAEQSRLGYEPIRKALVMFGKDVGPELIGKAEDDDLLVRTLAKSLLYETRHPKKMKEIYLNFGTEYVQQNSIRSTGNPVSDREHNLFNGWQFTWAAHHREYNNVPSNLPFELQFELAIAYGQPVDILRAIGKTDVNNKNQVKEFTEFVDGYLAKRQHPDVVRALSTARFGTVVESYKKLLQKNPNQKVVQIIIEGLLIAGSKDGVPLLESIIVRAAKNLQSQKSDEVTPIAIAVLEAIKNDGVGVEELLKHDKESVRFAAARALTNRKNPACVEELVRIAGSRKGEKFDEVVDLILSLDEKAIGELKRVQKTADDRSRQVLCETLIQLISDSGFRSKLEKAKLIRTFGFRRHAGPSVEDMRASGHKVAEFLGEKGIPALESSAYFEGFGMNAGIVMFALAKFKNERSLPAIQSSMRHHAFYMRGGNVAVEALKEFGKPGIELAKSIPKADPTRENFRGRAGRSRSATQLLVDVTDPKAIDNLIDALRTIRKPDEKNEVETYYQWKRRMVRYMWMTGNIEGERLVPILLNFVNHSEGELVQTALRVMNHIDDPRIAKAVPGSFDRSDPSNCAESVRELIRYYPEDAANILVKKLAKAESKLAKDTLLRSISIMVTKGPYFYEILKLKKPKNSEDVFIEPLIAQLKTVDPKQREQLKTGEAAANILTYFDPTDDQVVIALSNWVARPVPRYDSRVLDFLVRSKSSFAKIGLLEAYQKSHHYTPLAKPLGQLKYKRALDDLIIGVDKRIEDQKYRYGIQYNELFALVALGPEGIRKVYEVLKSDKPLYVRSLAASALSTVDYKESKATIRDVVLELAKEGIEFEGIPDIKSVHKTRQEIRSEYLRQSVSLLAESLLKLDGEFADNVFLEAIARTEDRQLVSTLVSKRRFRR